MTKRMKIMTVKLLIEGDEVFSHHFSVSAHWSDDVRGLVQDKLTEIAKDFNVSGL